MHRKFRIFLLIIISTITACNGSSGGGNSKTNPIEPINLNTTALTDTRIELTWEDKSTNEDGFTIEQSTVSTSEGFEEIANTEANMTKLEISDLSAATIYYYRVLAFNVQGQSLYSNVVSVTTLNAPPEIPLSPANLIISEKTSKTMGLAWEDRSENETNFVVEHAGYDTVNKVCEIFSELAILDANTLSYIHAKLQPNSLHCYRIKAINDSGDSPYSNVLSNEKTLNQLTLTLNINAVSNNLTGSVLVYQGMIPEPVQVCERTGNIPALQLVTCNVLIDENSDVTLKVNYFDVIEWVGPAATLCLGANNTCKFKMASDLVITVVLSRGV